MTQIQVQYLGELRTEALHIRSGKTFITDAPTDNNGKGEAFSPTDTICAALASCMMTIIGIVAKRESIILSDFSANVNKIMTDTSPRKIDEIQIDFILENCYQLSDKHKEMFKRAAYTCPVALSLHPDINKVITFNF